MKEKSISRSHLFLIELILVILFFAIASSIALQVFVKASDLADSTMALNGGMMLAQSTAEIDKNTPFEELDLSERTEYFDEHWQKVDASTASYALTSKVELEDRWAGIMANFTYKITSSETLIYQLQAKKYYSMESLMPVPEKGGTFNE